MGDNVVNRIIHHAEGRDLAVALIARRDTRVSLIVYLLVCFLCGRSQLNLVAH